MSSAAVAWPPSCTRSGYSITESHPEYVVVGKTANFNFATMRKATQLIDGGAKFIGTNPDLIDPVEGGTEPAAGVILAAIEAATGKKPYIVGKPNSLMMIYARQMLGAHAEDCVMIGDRMDTDIVGGLGGGDAHRARAVGGVKPRDDRAVPLPAGLRVRLGRVDRLGGPAVGPRGRRLPRGSGWENPGRAGSLPVTTSTAIQIPTLLRVKPNTLYKLGKYLRRNDFNSIALFFGEGMGDLLGQTVEISLDSSEIKTRYTETVVTNDIEAVVSSAFALPRNTDAIVAVGGGMAIDYAKYAGFLAHKPVIAVPTALSNDGFASPGASLKVAGKRTSCPASIPFGVVLDTAVIAKSPPRFTFSGVGDLLSKYSAVHDWKLAYWETGEQVNDFAVLIALQSVENFVNYPTKSIGDLDFIKLMAGALVMSGVAMEVSGSSRPASGSEHLISHAYDKVADRPSMHGLQVGLASIATMWLQEHPRLEDVMSVLAETGFMHFVKENPLDRAAFVEAIRLAPTIKDDYFTILSPKGNVERLVEFVTDSPVWDGLLGLDLTASVRG